MYTVSINIMLNKIKQLKDLKFIFFICELNKTYNKNLLRHYSLKALNIYKDNNKASMSEQKLV